MRDVPVVPGGEALPELGGETIADLVNWPCHSTCQTANTIVSDRSVQRRARRRIARKWMELMDRGVAEPEAVCVAESELIFKHGSSRMLRCEIYFLSHFN